MGEMCNRSRHVVAHVGDDRRRTSKGHANPLSEESILKTELVKQCKARGWYARRIEDGYGVGILDITIVPTGYPTLFVEGKVTDGLKFAPSERQYVEGIRVIEAKGIAFPVLIGWRSQVMYIADWGREAFITKAFKQPSGANYVGTIEEWLRGKHNSS
jgi:hypothetical protein